MSKEELKNKFPKGFFTSIPPINRKSKYSKVEKDFKWSKGVLSGKIKATIVPLKEEN